MFETSADLTAVIGWNALPAQTTTPGSWPGRTPAPGSPARRTTSAPATRCCSWRRRTASRSPTGPADVHYVTAVTTDPASGNTQISWDGPLPVVIPGDGEADAGRAVRRSGRRPRCTARRRRTRRRWPVPHIHSTCPAIPRPLSTRAEVGLLSAVSTRRQRPDQSRRLLSRPARPPRQPVRRSAAVGRPDRHQPRIHSFFQITAAAETSPGYYTLTTKTTQLTLAARRQILGPATPAADADRGALPEFVTETPNVTAYVQSVPAHASAACRSPAGTRTRTYPRQAGMLAPVAGSSIPVAGGQQIAAGQPIGVSGKCLRLQVPAGAARPSSRPASPAARRPPTGRCS